VTPARPVNLFDLDPATRRKMAEAIGRHPAQPIPARVSGKASPPDKPRGSGKLRWACHQCGTVLASWAACQRHCNEANHLRYELVFP
jgi:hypothetical protein